MKNYSTEAYKKKTVAVPATRSKNAKSNLIKHSRKIYKIVWRDAFSDMDEWHDEDSIENQDYICETIGYLIEDNSKPNYYTIASTITKDEYFCCIINIPKAMVISKTRISL